jgi:xylulokinase
VEWFARLLGKSVDEMLRLLPQQLPTQLTTIVFRPYLYGERSPYFDHNLCASFDGIRGEHGPADLLQAVLQGVALQERLILECAERRQPVSVVAIAGGGARSDQWNHIRANILQRQLLILADSEASLRGAAMVAWRHPLTEDKPTWIVGETVQPDPAYAQLSDSLMKRFTIGSSRWPFGVAS